MVDEEFEDDSDQTVSITLYPSESIEKSVLTLGAGMKPFILVQPEYDDDTNTTTWKVIGSLVDDMNELVDFMEASLDVVKAAIEQNAGTDD